MEEERRLTERAEFMRILQIPVTGGSQNGICNVMYATRRWRKCKSRMERLNLSAIGPSFFGLFISRLSRQFELITLFFFDQRKQLLLIKKGKNENYSRKPKKRGPSRRVKTLIQPRNTRIQP